MSNLSSFGSIRRSRWAVVIAAVAAAATVFLGCQSDQLSEDEEQTLRDIFRSGLEMQADPFVRAETLRAMTLAGDPDLAEHAEPLIRDRHPMVRVAALNKMIRAQHPRARQRALLVFNRAEEDEQLEIFELSVAHGGDTLRRAIIDRALRTDSSRLRMRALEEGLLRQIDEARNDGDDRTLERELLPELSAFVDDDDPQIAAVALDVLTDAGQRDRADAFIDVLRDDGQPIEQRITAARTLVFARIEEAEEIYAEILDSVGAYDPDSLGIPERRIDERLLRLAVLGKAHLGHTEFVDPAMQYLDDASTDETLEILEVLAANPSEDASIALRTHMRDANPIIRRRAVTLYGQRDDLRADALLGAMRPSDYEFQQMVIATLAEHFPERWNEYLGQRLDDSNPVTVEETLRSMQTMLRTEEELATVTALQDRLQTLATGEDLPFETDDITDERAARLHSIANVAAYLLFRVSDDDESYREVIRENPDPQTRYVYLEHLVTHHPEEHVRALRDYLYDDVYALRLMAAAGLWQVFSDQLAWAVAAEEDGGDGEEE